MRSGRLLQFVHTPLFDSTMDLTTSGKAMIRTLIQEL